MNYSDEMLLKSIVILTDNKAREELTPLYSESLMIVSTNLDRLREIFEK